MSRDKRPLVIDKPVAILVEGIDWFHFLREQITDGPKMKPEFENVRLYDFKGVKQLGSFLETLRKHRDFEHIQALGIMRDIEAETGNNSRRNVIATVRSVLNGYDFSAPKKPQEIDTSQSIAISYLLIPHDADMGCLEHAILNAVRDQDVLNCAQDFYDCIDPDKIRNDNARAKMIVRSIIATTHKDGYTLGQSVHANLWDLEHESVRVMLDFIRSLVSFLD